MGPPSTRILTCLWPGPGRSVHRTGAEARAQRADAGGAAGTAGGAPSSPGGFAARAFYRRRRPAGRHEAGRRRCQVPAGQLHSGRACGGLIRGVKSDLGGQMRMRMFALLFNHDGLSGGVMRRVQFCLRHSVHARQRVWRCCAAVLGPCQTHPTLSLAENLPCSVLNLCSTGS